MDPISRSLTELDSRAFERLTRSNPLVIIPVGALEAHGPHLPLGADQIQAESTARTLAERVDGYIAPTLPYGNCSGTSGFPGTISLSPASLSSTARELLEEFARHGVRRILVLSGHAGRGHMAALRDAGESAMRSSPGLKVVVLSDYDFVYELRGKESPASDGHGGLLETSRVLSMTPTIVGAERPVVERRDSPFVPGPPSHEEWPESVQGDTRPSTAALGARVQAHVVDRLEETVRALLPK